MKQVISKINKPIDLELKIPGDKSISHRAVIFGSIANGTTRVSNFLNGDDCLCTLEAFSTLGVEHKFLNDEKTELEIYGKGMGALKAPEKEIYLGNSGTAMRLLAGLFSGLPFETRLTGDDSLSKRPMKRIIDPLRQMGADIGAREDNFAPLVINKDSKIESFADSKMKKLKAVNYESKIASAQVKSAILLAGLNAEGEASVSEPHFSRNHTELMLKGFGGKGNLQACEFIIPSDISSAAFFMVAAAILPDAKITLRNIGLNPTRTGIIDVLKKMKANLEISNESVQAGEPIGDIVTKSSKLEACEISGELIPRLIDEIPIIAILASQAKGTTLIRDAHELRVKESDRIATTVNMLKSLGVEVEEQKDGMVIHGRVGKAFEPLGDKLTIDSHGDHRIAMSSAIAALHSETPIEILQTEFVDTSFPGFFDLLKSFS